MGDKGKLFVISGPSGVGKGTVLDCLMEQKNVDAKYSISATTRKPRYNEKEGRDYFFLSKEEFLAKKENDKFIETAQVHNNYYGTPQKNVENNLKKGNNIILEIDIQGAKQIRNKFKEAILIFLEPPSLSELKQRLNKRDSEDEKNKKLRLNNAKCELKEKVIFDYTVINEDIKQSAEELKKIIFEETKKEEKKYD